MNPELLDKLLNSFSFISREAGRIEGKHEEDWLATDAIQREVDRLREMLATFKTVEEVPVGALTDEAEDRRVYA
jgi:hypothetical protein